MITGNSPKIYKCSICGETKEIQTENYSPVYKYCYFCSDLKQVTENTRFFGTQPFRRFDFVRQLDSRGNFRDFLVTEQVEKPLTLVVVTSKNKNDKNGYYPSTQKVVDECEKRQYRVIVIFPEDYFVNVEDGKIVFNEFKGNKKYVVVPEDTVAFMRGSVINTANGKNIYQALEQNGVFTVNSMKAMELCSNKFATYRVLLQNKIPTPRTFLLTKNESSIEKGLTAIGGKFPVIVKTLNGAEGIGVSIIESEQSLKGVLQTLWTFNAELLLQEFLEIDGDVRVIVLDGKPIAAMKRNKLKKDFRSNASLGATTDKYELSKEEEELAVRTAKKLNCFYCGIDIFNVGGKLYIVEVNTSPGSEGITKTSGVNVIGKFLDYIGKRENWKHSNYREVGYVEKIKIFAGNKELFFGDAKFDTGNGITSSIHAENIREVGEKVSFTFNGKNLTLPIERRVKVIKHQRQVEDSRFTVKMSIQIGDKKLDNIEFALTNREGTIKELEPVLISRDVLTQFKLTVIPDKKYMLSEAKKFLKA